MKRFLGALLLLFALPLSGAVRDVASSATITLSGSGVYRITGTATISTILGLRDGDLILLLPAAAFALTTGGNIEPITATATAGRPITMAQMNGTVYEVGPSTAASITTPVSIANGGTGQATATLGFDALAPTTTKGDVIARTSTGNVRVAVGIDGDVLTADAASAAGVKFAAGPSGTGPTQYAEDTVAVDAEMLTMAGVVRNDTPSSLVSANGDRGELQIDAVGRLWVNGSNVTQPVSGTFWQATQPVSGTFWQATQPVSAASLPLPTGAATETTLAKLPIAQSTALGTNSGPLVQGSVTTAAPTYTTGNINPLSLTTAGLLRTDGSGVTQPVSGTVTTTPPANASTNVAQLAGTATDTNSGLKSAGTLRVVLATDQPQLTNKLLVTPDSVALPANQSVNVAQINAVTPLMGNGVTGTGSQRVTIASDNTAFAVNATLSAETTKVIGTVTANAGTNLNTSALALDATLTGGTQRTKVTDGTNNAAVKAASTAAVAADPALVVAVSPNNTIPVNQTQFNGVAVSVGQGVSNTGSLRVTQSQELSYSAGLTIKTNTAAGTAPFFSLCGSATTTVAVQRFQMTGTVATAAVWGDVIIKRTSTATSGGTATTLTVLPMDSTNAAGTAVAKYYTVLPTAGTSAGVVAAQTQLFPVTAISATLQPSPAPMVWRWRDQDSQPVVLRGIAQCLEVNFGTTTTNVPTLTLAATWTEK